MSRSGEQEEEGWRGGAVAAGGSGLLNTGIKVIHHELSAVQPDYSSLPPKCVLEAWEAWGAWEAREAWVAREGEV